jgi:hypothetical protein
MREVGVEQLSLERRIVAALAERLAGGAPAGELLAAQLRGIAAFALRVGEAFRAVGLLRLVRADRDCDPVVVDDTAAACAQQRLGRRGAIQPLGVEIVEGIRPRDVGNRKRASERRGDDAGACQLCIAHGSLRGHAGRCLLVHSET